MNINELIAIVKKKLGENIVTENILVEDKTFLHKKHPGNEKNKFHLKIKIQSKELSKLNKIESNKKIYKILNVELKDNIHSLQILIN
ncbi:BolA/IbaG family iron-sulfur metabolism protein [Pelagibacterales bacterium SAG-MED13]|nr:BolA/IbaG family iron-sulfur metabolism protein [Pelagibacterales bacterium SAG-MED13]|tara:strand:- start:105 stop:365 length:261 start_codon:yes stop_codon:yes gene_type:complete